MGEVVQWVMANKSWIYLSLLQQSHYDLPPPSSGVRTWGVKEKKVSAGIAEDGWQVISSRPP